MADPADPEQLLRAVRAGIDQLDPDQHHLGPLALLVQVLHERDLDLHRTGEELRDRHARRAAGGPQQVVALDDVLVVNFFGKPTLSCDDTAPEGECEETPLSFPPGSVITFGNPGHCWSAANACGPGGTITKLCSTSGTSACPLTMRDFAGEQLYLDHFDCGAAVTLVLDGLSAPRLVR